MASAARDWRSRVEALLEAGRDIREDSSRQIGIQLDSPHASLHGDYRRDLRVGKQWGESWWKSVVETEMTRATSPAEAEHWARKEYPGAAACHPGVIAILRKYWIACAALNESSPPDQRIAPEEFLLGTLVESPDQDLAEFLSSLPYWPIGMDANGAWI